MDKPILYSFRRCPYAMRARLSLLKANITCEMREVVLRDRPPHMLEISPKGTVPVLLLPNGEVLEESLDISVGNSAEGVIGKVAVPIMEGMEDREKRGGFALPLVDDGLVGVSNDHSERMANESEGASREV